MLTHALYSIPMILRLLPQFVSALHAALICALMCHAAVPACSAAVPCRPQPTIGSQQLLHVINVTIVTTRQDVVGLMYTAYTLTLRTRKHAPGLPAQCAHAPDQHAAGS